MRVKKLPHAFIRITEDEIPFLDTLELGDNYEVQVTKQRPHAMVYNSRREIGDLQPLDELVRRRGHDLLQYAQFDYAHDLPDE